MYEYMDFSGPFIAVGVQLKCIYVDASLRRVLLRTM